ncbi:hypothetical protein QR680_016789 [Steinernema hermaphroditum]|uniref:Uncharacterized protein n=1 Tax=Steinernema hermaphroditum TaxID=289476 RepID=A0AA39LN74_9BILA|nr:hypothetical protein QR680_016789 [Steinernema hermaphroditum]
MANRYRKFFCICCDVNVTTLTVVVASLILVSHVGSLAGIADKAEHIKAALFILNTVGSISAILAMVAVCWRSQCLLVPLMIFVAVFAVGISVLLVASIVIGLVVLDRTSGGIDSTRIEKFGLWFCVGVPLHLWYFLTLRQCRRCFKGDALDGEELHEIGSKEMSRYP